MRSSCRVRSCVYSHGPSNICNSPLCQQCFDCWRRIYQLASATPHKCLICWKWHGTWGCAKTLGCYLRWPTLRTWSWCQRLSCASRPAISSFRSLYVWFASSLSECPATKSTSCSQMSHSRLCIYIFLWMYSSWALALLARAVAKPTATLFIYWKIRTGGGQSLWVTLLWYRCLLLLEQCRNRCGCSSSRREF